MKGDGVRGGVSARDELHELVSALTGEEDGVEEVAARMGVTLGALVARLESAEVMSMLSGVCRAGHERAELVISRARAAAARRLLELARDGSNPETSRKACVDLLKHRPSPATGDAAAHVNEDELDAGTVGALREWIKSAES